MLFVNGDMMNSVNLAELVGCLEIQTDVCSYYVNRNTGEIIHLMEEDIVDTEESEQGVAGQIDVSSDEYVRIPSKWDIHEYEIMQDFIFSLQPGIAQDDLRYATRGAGAFRMFKRTLARYDLEELWYEFLHDQLRKKAIQWCEENKVAFFK